MTMPSFEKKKILVTGASKGLGAVCARAFAAQGAQVVLIARSFDKLEEVRKSFRSDQTHLSLSADFTDLASVRSASTRAMEFTDGVVDVVLHAAGGGLGLKQNLLPSEDLWKLFLVNLGAAAEINRWVAPKMIERR